jgi:hypothetical protein
MRSPRVVSSFVFTLEGKIFWINDTMHFLLLIEDLPPHGGLKRIPALFPSTGVR